ncbi:helix-turn-helix domain-containing protein [Natrialbaceae archaeon AArc-T1-2]|uniref:helix-turn-helix domain-containing protein n=1 Tax=Natrialbaceae archaeon AArc-T1-2 TaxID=3053904 RepID=UPI00255B3B57|nr:helix-turn-helix domain-containing protein [Natrialbaceae archaeon AArc-T1-2]WIV67434.1 helix-turn-helix domain-containing protein [Natrialbaceae archaeon AArc-T1-2]
MGFTAEVRVAHDGLPLIPTIERHPGVTLRYEYTVRTDETTGFVSVFSDEYTAFAETMESDPTVSDPTRVASFENRAIYRVTVDTDREIVPPHCLEHGLFVFTITSGDGCWIVRVLLPDRATLTAFRDYCRGQGVSFRMCQLYDSAVSDDSAYFLTDRQHEILSMAYYGGYFDIPRSITQDDLAEQLGISDSAVSQRLRRAVKELIAAMVENDRTADRHG